MSEQLLLLSHDFLLNIKSMLKPHEVQMIDTKAEILNNSAFKNIKLICVLVNTLYKGYDKLTLVSNFERKVYHNELYKEGILGFILNTNDIGKMYELSDFHAAVMSHVESHKLLVQSRSLLKKELVSAKLSKTINNSELPNKLLKAYEALISQSESLFDNYREALYLKFGLQQHL
ncbi:hypothetical protein [Methylotenera sp.]|uniref:hypothetical protein n=1 Tax=Methylotenera sp. TaxID=2051956 RepID=UPI0027325079|nr:hypothetical protein [Methylotenera sp.]MDP3211925.1 hypothetical protein [Methylotenera sp.]